MFRQAKNKIASKKWLLVMPLVLVLCACGSDLYSHLVPGAKTAEQLEQAATLQYNGLVSQAQTESVLASKSDPNYQRLQRIAKDLIPYASQYNPKATQWNWEVSLFNSDQINAMCMPGGKIVFFTGIIEKLQLTDDEIAMIMGHEMSHALREHALSQINKDATTKAGLSIGSKAAGIDNSMTQGLSSLGAQLLSLKFSRTDETDADRIGQELAAQAGYNPQAAITLWEKMDRYASGSGGAAFLSTHPQNDERIQDLKANLPRVMPLYEAAKKAKN